MPTTTAQHERRAAQRFDFNLPVSLTVDGQSHNGYTQNVSGRGVCLLVDCDVSEGSSVELTFAMPAEITLAEVMHVRCRAKVLRTSRDIERTKFAVAVCLEHYEYLSGNMQPAAAHDFERIVCLHEERERELLRQNSMAR